MDHVIYHSKDLDGLTSAAVLKSYQNGFGEDCFLTPYDYGEKLDTRKFRAKSVVMIDVSMEMDRMQMLGDNCMEFMWIDHHHSAKEKVFEYCKEKGYEIIEDRFNDLILRYTIKGMNMTYIYSERLSGCEIALSLYGTVYSDENSNSLIRALGQYDTWRNTEEKMFVSDKDWESHVMPIQYFMRSCKNPDEVLEMLRNSKVSGFIDFAKKTGEAILKYQKIQNESIIKNHFEFEFKGLKIIALNTPLFSSQSFEGYYAPEIHDAMMPFLYDGKSGDWKFSLYTTKEDIDILSIAKEFGGGGHKGACGFAVNPIFVKFENNEINFYYKSEEVDILVNETTLINSTLLDQKTDILKIPSIFKTIPSKKSHVYKANEHGEFLVPNLFAKKFDDFYSRNDPEFYNEFQKYLLTQEKQTENEI